MITETPAPRLSPLAVIVFVAAALFIPCGLFGFHFILWSMEQTALATASLAPLAHAGKIGLAAQAIVLLALSGLLYGFARQPRLRPIYQSWLIAGAVAIPAVVLRFLGPNQDQLGSMIQIALAFLFIALAFIIRRKSLQFNARPAISALAFALFAIWPFALYGALGSPPDALLNIIAGLAFGLLAALLASTSAGNFWLNGLGNAALLAMLGSAYGYDGGQLILAAILPIFGFAVAALSPSVAAAAVFVGVVAAAPLMFFDPTEFTIVLGGGEIGSWAARAALIMIGWGGAISLAMWLIGKWAGRPKTVALPLAASLISWAGLLFIVYAFGQRGFHGDRLFVIMKDQADVSEAYAIGDRNARLEFVYGTLIAHANTTQADLRNTLDRFGARYKPYYLVNALEVEGGTLVRLYLATRSDVDRVIDSPRLRPLPEPIAASPGFDTTVAQSPGWNITLIGADKVWNEFGITGQGVIIGQSDSGVDGNHPALRDSYRGLEEGDDYNWFDPWDGTSSPNDEGGHGTHTLGTVLGGGGIGVAPGAQWIGCVNLNRNLGNPALYLDCMQFMLAPFPQGGNPLADGDPARAAHVLNNSWGCPPIEGCDPNSLKPAVEALRAAGIFVVVSTGNDGPNCETVNAPLALYDSVFSVGAIDAFGNVADFSSRGPVAVDGSGRIKPDIAAPGVEVFSSLPEGTYGANSGTSMAGPHVAGVVALLWSAQPTLVGDMDRTEQILIDTAQPFFGAVNGCSEGNAPSTAYGFGVVDAYRAVAAALGK